MRATGAARVRQAVSRTNRTELNDSLQSIFSGPWDVHRYQFNPVEP
jgi:hypothetical protein